MKKMLQALVKIKVASAKVTTNGKLLVSVPNRVNESEVKENLMSTSSGNFCLREVKKRMPKITITNAPNNTTEKTLHTKICDKNAL